MVSLLLCALPHVVTERLALWVALLGVYFAMLVFMYVVIAGTVVVGVYVVV